MKETKQDFFKVRLNGSIPFILSDRQLKSLEKSLEFANVQREVIPLGAKKDGSDI